MTITDERERRLRTYPMVLLAALAAAFVIVVVAGDGSSTASGRVGGDFPAFYSAGSIVADGRIDDLWDPAVQAAAQADLLGDEDGFIMFPYAPHVAAAYAGLAQLPYRAAYSVHTVLMVGLLVAALHLLRPLVGVVDRRFPLVLAATLTAYPVFVGIGGGQNTALTMFLLAWFWRSLADDEETMAGLAVAALTFRPQYALPLAGLLLLGRHRRAVVVAALGGAGVWVVNALLAGPTWVTDWLSSVRPLLEADAEINARNEIAPIGFLHSLLGVESTAAAVVGGAVSLGVGLVLVTVWWRRTVPLDLRIALTAAGLILLGPHTIHYDSALLVFAALVLFDRGAIPLAAVGALWLAGLTHVVSDTAGTTPLAVVVLAAFAVVLAVTTRAQERVLPIQEAWSPA